VLEVGVGTGMALSVYPRHCQVTGVDLARRCSSTPRSASRATARHVQVMEGDAMDLSLPDNSFDYVTAFHVVSVVPDARRMMAEVQRVCKPNGTIVVINHFRSDRRASPWTGGWSRSPVAGAGTRWAARRSSTACR
jgi:phosphatidylethanolamine/phosphatidyl-N-methylethanolamine N-methyltransferase